MFARVLLGLVVSLPLAARADMAAQQALLQQQASAAAASQSYTLLAATLQANAIAQESTFQYGQPANMDPFSARSSWQDLRIRNAGSSRSTSSRLLTAPRAATIVRTGIRYQPNSGRVGGLGRQISGDSPSLSLHGIGSGTSGASTPSFGNLHEGTESFSFSRP